MAWRAASRYVRQSRAEALETADRLLAQGHAVSIDLFGERVLDPEVADGVLADYLELVAALAGSSTDVWLSVDLSHLGVTTDPRAAADRLAEIARALPDGRRVQIGAEEAVHTDAILWCVIDVAERGLADRLGATLQANLVRTVRDLELLAEAGVHIRLVKGAYVESDGAFAYGEPTDIAFLQLGRQLAQRGLPWSAATHDGRLREALLLTDEPLSVEQLLGVRPDVLAQLSIRDIPTRVYVPYGPDWFRYWMRRVAESRGV